MDFIVQFPNKFSRGDEFILIVYHDDTNTILGSPIKNRQVKTIVKAWKHL